MKSPTNTKTVLVAFDKFKDALSAHAACQAAAEAIAERNPDWTITTSPLADGGDGFCDTLTKLCDGTFETCDVVGPLGQPTSARYGIVETSKLSTAAAQQLDLPPRAAQLAIIEFAQSSGIALVPQNQRSPWTTTSFGLGQTIDHACKNGADSILIGLGGSATHDLALGALQALGFRFLPENQNASGSLPTPQNWKNIQRIEPPTSSFPLPVRIACDVENPLLGPNGAAAIFGPQKGLLPADLPSLDSQTQRLATLLCQATGTEIQAMNTAGTGAAGGAAFGLMTALHGEVVSGADLVFAWSNLHEKLAAADIVITGEGRFDASSLQGKGPGSLAKLALEQGKELIILAGSLGDLPHPNFASLARPISPPDLPLAQALAETESNLRLAIASIFGN